MKSKMKWYFITLTILLIIGLVTGYLINNEKPNKIIETTFQIDNDEPMITQEGFLHGFPEENLVEFNVIEGEKETLRIFEVGEDIKEYLSDESHDGKTKLLLSYKESENGISYPKLMKVEKTLNEK